MKRLFIVTLTPNTGRLSLPTDDLQTIKKDHHDYIDELVTNKTILLGGPVLETPNRMLLVHGSSIEEIRSIFEKDPLVKKEFMILEVHEWQIKHGRLPVVYAS